MNSRALRSRRQEKKTTDSLTLAEGRLLVRVARDAVGYYISTGERPTLKVKEPRLHKKMGVFTTLRKVVEGNLRLRGCIGFPTATKPLAEAAVDSAIAAATDDPRFPPIRMRELGNVVFSLSVLSPLRRLRVSSPLEYPSRIQVGRHGAVIEWGAYGGLLLPEVPVEESWDEEDYLANLCLKAGLPPDAWLTERTRIYVFTSQVFEEETPAGPVKLRKSL